MIIHTFPENMSAQEKEEIIAEMNAYYEECIRLREEDILEIAAYNLTHNSLD